VLVMAQSCALCGKLIYDRKLRYSHSELLFAMAADGRATQSGLFQRWNSVCASQ
jgi:hypothetical protein